jgi:hypothetical protein
MLITTPDGERKRIGSRWETQRLATRNEHTTVCFRSLVAKIEVLQASTSKNAASVLLWEDPCRFIVIPLSPASEWSRQTHACMHKNRAHKIDVGAACTHVLREVCGKSLFVI